MTIDPYNDGTGRMGGKRREDLGHDPQCFDCDAPIPVGAPFGHRTLKIEWGVITERALLCAECVADTVGAELVGQVPAP